MNTRLYVGNLSYSTTEERLQAVFAPFGEVSSCKMISDRETGRFRGFAFVEMASQEAAQAAIKGLDGHEVDGRQLRVNIAQEKKPTGGPRHGGYRGDRGSNSDYY